jgi:large subunit ribosomal protein L29
MALKSSQLRELSPEELRDREQELADKLFSFRLQKVTGQLEKPSKVREAKRDLARVLTVLREKRSA